jgi:hypothetical protein
MQDTEAEAAAGDHLDADGAADDDDHDELPQDNEVATAAVHVNIGTFGCM